MELLWGLWGFCRWSRWRARAELVVTVVWMWIFGDLLAFCRGAGTFSLGCGRLNRSTHVHYFLLFWFFFSSIVVYFRFSAFFKMYRIRILKDHRCRHDICTENSDQSPKSPTETSLGMPRTEFSGAHRAEIMSVSTRRRVFFSPLFPRFFNSSSCRFIIA